MVSLTNWSGMGGGPQYTVIFGSSPCPSVSEPGSSFICSYGLTYILSGDISVHLERSGVKFCSTTGMSGGAPLPELQRFKKKLYKFWEQISQITKTLPDCSKTSLEVKLPHYIYLYHFDLCHTSGITQCVLRTKIGSTKKSQHVKNLTQFCKMPLAALLSVQKTEYMFDTGGGGGGGGGGVFPGMNRGTLAIFNIQKENINPGIYIIWT